MRTASEKGEVENLQGQETRERYCWLDDLKELGDRGKVLGGGTANPPSR